MYYLYVCGCMYYCQESDSKNGEAKEQHSGAGEVDADDEGKNYDEDGNSNKDDGKSLNTLDGTNTNNEGDSKLDDNESNDEAGSGNVPRELQNSQNEQKYREIEKHSESTITIDIRGKPVALRYTESLKFVIQYRPMNTRSIFLIACLCQIVIFLNNLMQDSSRSEGQLGSKWSFSKTKCRF